MAIHRILGRLLFTTLTAAVACSLPPHDDGSAASAAALSASCGRGERGSWALSYPLGDVFCPPGHGVDDGYVRDPYKRVVAYSAVLRGEGGEGGEGDAGDAGDAGTGPTADDLRADPVTVFWAVDGSLNIMDGTARVLAAAEVYDCADLRCLEDHGFDVVVLGHGGYDARARRYYAHAVPAFVLGDRHDFTRVPADWKAVRAHGLAPGEYVEGPGDDEVTVSAFVPNRAFPSMPGKTVRAWRVDAAARAVRERRGP